jgi:hypothetical protein
MVFLLSLFHGIIKVEKLFFTFLKRDQLLMPQRSGEVKENKNSFRLFFSSTIRIFCTEHREPGGFASHCQKMLEKCITKEILGKVDYRWNEIQKIYNTVKFCSRFEI